MMSWTNYISPAYKLLNNGWKNLDLQFEVCDPKFTSVGIHVEPAYCTNFIETVILHRCTLLPALVISQVSIPHLVTQIAFTIPRSRAGVSEIFHRPTRWGFSNQPQSVSVLMLNVCLSYLASLSGRPGCRYHGFKCWRGWEKTNRVPVMCLWHIHGICLDKTNSIICYLKREYGRANMRPCLLAHNIQVKYNERVSN